MATQWKNVGQIQGPKGEPTTAINVIGNYPTLADLQAAVPTGQQGDAYYIVDEAVVYTWSSRYLNWFSVGPISQWYQVNELLTMGPPDWDNIENVNLPIPYTADRDGYVQCVATSAANSNGYFLIYINDVLEFQVRCTPVTEVVKTVAVKVGDVVNIPNILGSTSTRQIKFIPSVIKPPVYLQQAPVIDYSTVEQDTGIKALDGKPIYQKTIVVNVPIPEDTQVVIGSVNNLLSPDLDRIIKYEITGSNLALSQDPKIPSATLFRIAANLLIYCHDALNTVGSWLTVWYTKI